MGKVLTALALLLVVLVAAILIGPSFVDWNQYKAVIAEEAEKATGRKLTIEGDVSLAILPSPALSAEQVSLANIDGGSQPEMLDLEALQIEVAMLPLLGGRIQVQSVSLVRPRILLEVLPDGRSNWDFAETASAAAETATGGAGEQAPAGGDSEASGGDAGGGEDFTVRVDNFVIEQGTLVYRDAPSGREERVEAIDARIVAETLRGPFAVTGEVTSHGMRGRIEATLGQLPEAGATTFNLTLGLPDAPAEAQFNGTLSRHPESFGLRGKLKGQGENLAALVDLLAPEAQDLPAALRNAFSLEGVIEADNTRVMATELRLGLGSTTLESNLTLALGPPMDLRVKLAAARLDLDELLAGAGPAAPAQAKVEDEPAAPSEAPEGEAATASAPASETAVSEAAQAFALPSDLNGALDLTVDAVVLRGQVIRQVRVSALLNEGRLSLDQALALLPGGSDVALTGVLEASEQGPRFQGRLEGASDNLRAVLDWLGAPVAEVPADRLRRMSVTSRIDATASQLSLSEFDLRVDLSRLAGGVVVALRERPGLGIGLALDTLNLDAYLPRDAAAASASSGTAAQPQGGDSKPASDAAAEPADAPARTEAAGPLQAFDANLNLRVGALTYQGQSARDITLQGTLQDGALSITEASVADLAGSALSYSGAVSGLDGRPAVDGTLDLRIADPVKLAALAGVQSDLLGRIGAFNMTGNVSGSLDGLAFNSKLAVLGGRFGLAGTARLLAAPLAFDVTLDAKHPDALRLSRALAGPNGLRGGIGGLDLKARLAGTPTEVAISGLQGRLGPFGLDGGLGLDLNGARPAPRDLNLALNIKHDSLAKLSRALGGPALGEGLGGVELAAKVSGGGERIRVTEMSGIAGPLGLSGNIDAVLVGGQPSLGDFNLNVRLKHRSLARLASAAGLGARVDPNLGGVDMGAHVFGNAGRVELRDLRGTLGPVEMSGSANVVLGGARPMLTAELTTGDLPLSRLIDGAGGAGGSGGTGAGSLSPRWSGAPIDLSGLGALDANLKIKSSAIQHQDLRLANADFAGSLSNGVLDVSRLSGNMFGGALQVRGKLDGQGVPALGLAITAIEIDSNQLLRRMAKFDRVSGPVTLNANISSRGRSEAELVSALSGSGDLAGQLQVQAKAEEAVGAALLSVLGQQVREVRGLTDTGTSLFQAFAGTSSRLSGTFRIERGLVQTNDLRLDGRDAVALTRGSASLPAWQVNSRTDVYRNQNPDSPFLTATLTGPLDKPNAKIGGDVFQRRDESAPSTTGPAPTNSQPQPQQLQDVKPEDLLKGLLNKLGQ